MTSPCASRATNGTSSITDPRHPLLDKAIQAQLAPGSTFKIIMSLAGLENNVAQDLKVVCNGGANFFGMLLCLR